MEFVSGVPVWGWVLVAIGSATLLIAIVSWITSEPRYNLADKVVVITGGSSGIGKAIAEESLKRGAHVALLARKPDLLSAAVRDLQKFKINTTQNITSHAVDVANDEATKRAFVEIAAQHGGRVDVLVNSAGISLPKTFEDTSAAEFANVYMINVVGTRNATHAALPLMRNGGRILFVSSQAGQAGIYGYTAYSASKFALQGFAQALQQEVWTRNIRVSLCFPPDTDTPMLQEENKQKPLITKLLSESTAMVPADVVARATVDGIVHWRPQIAVGFDGWMLSVLTAGMGPAGSLAAAVVHVLTTGLWRMVALFIVFGFYSTVSKHDTVRTTKGAEARPISSAKELAAPLVEEDSKRK